MVETPEHLIERLRTEGEKTHEFFCRLTPDQWNLTLYTDVACWTIRQLLAHFVATEKAFSQLIEDILKGGSRAPEDFDINA